jgi:CRISPR-associated protein Csh2
LGRQSRLQEGHYLHHFSINPNNLRDIIGLAAEGAKTITSADIAKLKDAMCKGVTYYDSAAKAGTDNELTIWIQLKEGSKVVLPNINSLITQDKVTKEDGKMLFDLSGVSAITNKYKDDIETYEVFYQKENTIIKNGPAEKNHIDLN